MSSHALTYGARARPQVMAHAWPWLLLAVAGIAVFFHDALSALVIAWQRPEYSYGPVVPLIAGWLMLRELGRRPPVADSGSRMPGLVLVAVGLLLGLLGNLIRVSDIASYGLVITIAGFTLTLAGTRQGLRFWPALVMLLFMLPLPQILYLRASTGLQALSSQLGVALIDAMGIPVLLDGNVIDLGRERLQVAEACSGLSYLFPMLSFGWLVAVLYAGPAWHRVVLVASTVPLAILMNALRIGVIGLLVSRHGIAQAEGVLHAFEGWVVFMASIAILYGEALLLRRFASKRQRAPAVLDVGSARLLAPLRDLPQVPASTALATAVLMVLFAALAWQGHRPAEPPPLHRASLSSFPLQLGDWRGEPIRIEPATLRVLGADDYFNASYVHGSDRVDLLMTFYRSQAGGQGGVHSPEVCLPAGGWEVSQWERHAVSLAGPPQQRLTVNRALIGKGPLRQLVWYWFEQRGTHTPSEYAAKLLSLRDQLTERRSDGGLVRLVTPLSPGEDPAAADARLQAIMQQVVPMLPDYFPPS